MKRYALPLCLILIGIFLTALSITTKDTDTEIVAAIGGVSLNIFSFFLMIKTETDEIKKSIEYQNDYFDKVLLDALSQKSFSIVDAASILEEISHSLPKIRRVVNIRFREQEDNSETLKDATKLWRKRLRARFKTPEIFCLHEIIIPEKEILREANSQLDNYHECKENFKSKEPYKYNSEYKCYVYPNSDIVNMRNFIIVDYGEEEDVNSVIYWGWRDIIPNEKNRKKFKTYMSRDRDLIADYRERFETIVSLCETLEGFNKRTISE